MRKNPLKILSTIHKDISQARSWNTYRWKMGYLRVFDPTNKACVDADSRQSSETTDDDSDESEEN